MSFEFRIESNVMARTKKATLPAGLARDIAVTWARERPDLDPLDYLLPIYILRLGRIVEWDGNRLWKNNFGISSPDMRVLFALRRAGGDCSRRPTDLFRALLVTSGAMTKIVDRLGAEGLVKRRPDPSDKGGFQIQLTAKGKRIADDAMTQMAAATILTSSRISLSKTERKVMVDLLQRVLLEVEEIMSAEEASDR
ncbi:MarR family winged helix-turn-helix transcriptional regulator [Bradyrhizobium sp. SRS-191]|uniref:MarR family winged helix-turn-helix transcriptional regulator n=1 Tax=Bradyrhizobium sp. SRS-191 TaxID=2962606 RepID=UPI00211E9BF2|nr:MarR family transcriptional regulator [Bradyrhizobium sp. SRS-191]